MGRSNYRNLLRTSGVKCSWPQHTVRRNRIETKHGNGILQLCRRKLGIARGDAGTVFGTTQSILENRGWEFGGKSRSWVIARSLCSSPCTFGCLRGRSPNTNTDPVTEWKSQNSQGGKTPPRPSSPTSDPPPPHQSEQSTKTHLQSWRTHCTSYSSISFPRISN